MPSEIENMNWSYTRMDTSIQQTCQLELKCILLHLKHTWIFFDATV